MSHRCAPGDAVRIRAHAHPGHHRTSACVQGRAATVERYCGAVPNPEHLASGGDGSPAAEPCRVRLPQRALWPDCAGPAEAVRAEIEKLQAPGPRRGVALVARAWVDPALRERRLADGKAAAAEPGFSPPPGVRLRVHDSTADLRYNAPTVRPAGAGGWDEAMLVGLVDRDATTGVAPACDPSRAP